MQKILLTGANGFVGQYLARILPATCQVIATGKGPQRFSFTHANLQYQQLDITDAIAVKRLTDTLQPDVIVHSAAVSSPDACAQNKTEAFLVNVTATAYLLDAAKTHNSFFVFLSTDFIFDGERGMYSETDMHAPVNYYGHTKLEAEKRVQAYKNAWSIVRTVLVYGDPAGARGNLLTMVAESLRAKKPLRIFNDQLRTPTYVEDLAGGIFAIIQKQATGIFHISGAEIYTPYDMAVATARHLGLDAELLEPIKEGDLVQPAKRPLKTGFIIEKARRELGYEPVSFEEGLRRTFT